jgi:site-specific DNA-methyltransferase (adenine-specific)
MTTKKQRDANMPPMGDGNNDRRTPDDLFQRLHDMYVLTLDAAASVENAKLPDFCTLDGRYELRSVIGVTIPVRVSDEDGLASSWESERVFVNPPYGRKLLAPFIEKAHQETRVLKRCPIVVMLLPVRPEQSWWQRYVWDNVRKRARPGVSIEFIAGRLRYDGLKGAAPFPSCVVIFERSGRR